MLHLALLNEVSGAHTALVLGGGGGASHVGLGQGRPLTCQSWKIQPFNRRQREQWDLLHEILLSLWGLRFSVSSSFLRMHPSATILITGWRPRLDPRFAFSNLSRPVPRLFSFLPEFKTNSSSGSLERTFVFLKTTHVRNFVAYFDHIYLPIPAFDHPRAQLLYTKYNNASNLV